MGYTNILQWVADRNKQLEEKRDEAESRSNKNKDRRGDDAAPTGAR